MKTKKELFTFTNILFVLATVVYILNLFIISPDTGSVALAIKQVAADTGVPVIPLLYQILGTWGGHVNDLFNYSIDRVLDGEIWRILTVVLTHAHLPHYLMNMIALLIAGNHVEKKYGALKTIGLFVVLTTLNNFATDLICHNLLGYPVSISEGASGWITSAMGMILAMCLLNKGYFKQEFKRDSRIYLIIYFVSTTFILSANMFTITCHIAGLIFGMIAEFIITKISRPAVQNANNS